MLIVAIRTFIMYFALLVALRLMGKSELSKMSPFQLVVVFMIAELAAIPIDSIDASLINGLMSIFMLVFLQILLSFISTKSEMFKTIISGRPTLLIEGGKLNIKELSHQRITITDLMEQLRIKSCPSISDVEFAVLESNGELSVIKKSGKQPLTPDDMKMTASKPVFPSIIISDGNLYEENLALVGIGMNEFEDKLRKVNITSFGDVFLAFCDGSKKLHIYTADKKNDMFAKEVQI